jgi:hypothetical protein
MTYEEMLNNIGTHITSQINVTWDTETTLNEFIEMQKDGEDDGEEFHIEPELFLNYVRALTSDVVISTLENQGTRALESEMFLLDNAGETLDID